MCKGLVTSSSWKHCIQQVCYGTITIETGIYPMADRGTPNGPNGCTHYGAMCGTTAMMMLRLNVGPNDQPK